MKLSVLVPVYNEIKTIDEILKRIRATEYDKEIIVVDNLSTDGTREKLKEYEGDDDIKVIYHDKNLGKGGNIRTALKHMTGDIGIIQDADLEYSPTDYPAVLKPILDGRADVVYGSRFLGGEHHVTKYRHYLGNRWMTLISNLVTNLNLTDAFTCYKAFRAECVKGVRITSESFGVESELTAHFVRNGCRIYEVPITYTWRTHAEGKKINMWDGLAAFYWILKANLFG